MADTNWIPQFTFACKNLQSFWDETEEPLREKLKNHDAFVWLQEICEEANKFIAECENKDGKLHQIPKTPSIKKKAQKRRRPTKVKEEIEDAVVEDIKPSTCEPKLLKFAGSAAENRAEEAPETNAGRPLRKCRAASKVVYSDETPKKRTTRQSRKPAISKTEKTVTVSAVGQKDDKENACVEPSVDIPEKIGPNPAVSAAIPETITNDSPQKSPCVKERANAYEIMLKSRSSQSPVKPSRTHTPGSAGKFTPKVTESVQKSTDKTQTTVRVSTPRKSLRNSLHRRSSQRTASGRMSGQKKPKEVKPVRTRLRLNKQKQAKAQQSDGEEDMETISGDQALEVKATATVSDPQEEPQSLDSEEQSMEEEDTNDVKECEHSKAHPDVLNETEVIVTEVYEISGENRPAILKDFEKIQTKTTPMQKEGPEPRQCLSSDQGFNDGEEEEVEVNSDSSLDQNKAVNNTFTKEEVKEVQEVITEGRSTRTRTRALMKANETSALSSVVTEVSLAPDAKAKMNSTFTHDSAESKSPEPRSTRTRTRALKEEVSVKDTTQTITAQADTGMSTRTRQRKAEAEAEVNSKGSGEEDAHSTRRKGPKINPPPRLCGSDDEVVSGSPAINNPKPIRGGKKRLVEERGFSPHPKRSRSCIGSPAADDTYHPLSTSSPIKRGEDSDEISDLLSPRRSPRAFRFNSAQKKTSGFLNRTPGFGQNTSKVYSFLSNTPSYRSGGVLTSFLKRNTPPPKQTIQAIQEQKKKKLLEKESRERERLKKAADLRKQKIEQQKKQREEKERRAAEAREIKLRQEREQKERLARKMEGCAAIKDRVLEERAKEEREKQKLRLKKQMEADARRKQEEEEKLKKRLEQEEESKMQEEFMQRKKECEENERKRLIAEEKRKLEERLAEREQKRQEERERLKRAEEERERERERARLEKERMFAQEKAERDRIEKEKREERERKLKEELDKLKAMENFRLKQKQEEEQQKQMQRSELQQLIKKHNSSISKAPDPTSVAYVQSSISSNTMNNSKSSSYDITPVKKKVVSKQVQNLDDYGIDDKDSDDSTDDDEAPKKRIPDWAMGMALTKALMAQHLHPPDVEAIFRPNCIEPPDLTILFPGVKRRRYKERTSSAIWTSPLMKQDALHHS